MLCENASLCYYCCSFVCACVANTLALHAGAEKNLDILFQIGGKPPKKIAKSSQKRLYPISWVWNVVQSENWRQRIFSDFVKSSAPPFYKYNDILRTDLSCEHGGIIIKYPTSYIRILSATKYIKQRTSE